MSTSDGFVSLKDEAAWSLVSNADVVVPVGGRTKFKAEADGSSVLALYVNVTLPAPGSVERAALERGVVRTWFQQVVPGGAPRDITGLDNVRRVGLWGSKKLTLSAVWPHTVDPTVPWEFCVHIEAFDAKGKRVSVPLKASTREVKIVLGRSSR